MNKKELYELACKKLHEATKELSPFFNVAATNNDGNFIIPEYKEYCSAYMAYFLSREGDHEYAKLLQNSIKN